MGDRTGSGESSFSGGLRIAQDFAAFSRHRRKAVLDEVGLGGGTAQLGGGVVESKK